MINLKKVMVIALLILAMAIVACGPKTQPVARDNFEAARQEAMEAEQRVITLEREKAQLEAEIYSRQLLLDVLNEMVEEME